MNSSALGMCTGGGSMRVRLCTQRRAVAASCSATAAVIQDESIRALKWGLIGQGPELVGGQSCLDQHYRLTGAAKFDLQHRVGNGDTTRLNARRCLRDLVEGLV